MGKEVVCTRIEGGFALCSILSLMYGFALSLTNLTQRYLDNFIRLFSGIPRCLNSFLNADAYRVQVQPSINVGCSMYRVQLSMLNYQRYYLCSLNASIKVCSMRHVYVVRIINNLPK